jgi:hypothetical protein
VIAEPGRCPRDLGHKPCVRSPRLATDRSVVEDWIPALIVGIEPRQQLIEANLGTLAADHDLIVARNDFYCISYRKMSALEGGGTDPDGSAVAPLGDFAGSD